MAWRRFSGPRRHSRAHRPLSRCARRAGASFWSKACHMSTSDDASAVLDLLYGFRRSKVLFTAVRLGIFDDQRPHAAALPRLLDACVALGLLVRHGDAYVNTEVADRYLRSSSPASLSGY